MIIFKKYNEIRPYMILKLFNLNKLNHPVKSLKLISKRVIRLSRKKT